SRTSSPSRAAAGRRDGLRAVVDGRRNHWCNQLMTVLRFGSRGLLTDCPSRPASCPPGFLTARTCPRPPANPAREPHFFRIPRPWRRRPLAPLVSGCTMGMLHLSRRGPRGRLSKESCVKKRGAVRLHSAPARRGGRRAGRNVPGTKEPTCHEDPSRAEG